VGEVTEVLEHNTIEVTAPLQALEPWTPNSIPSTQVIAAAHVETGTHNAAYLGAMEFQLSAPDWALTSSNVLSSVPGPPPPMAMQLTDNLEFLDDLLPSMVSFYNVNIY
jgi:hypothetical protein